MNAEALLEAGRLSEAIAAVTEEVKKKPLDMNKRGFLAELLLIARQWDRADKQLDVIGHQQPDSLTTVSMWRQLIRAAKAREDFYNEGRIPEVLEEPDELMQAYFKASIFLREGNKSEAYQILEAAEAMRPHLSGTLNGEAFIDFRDLDDSSPGVLEILTTTGKYYWVPLTRIEHLAFHAPVSAVDLTFRRASIQTNKEGPEGEVFVPAIYPATPTEDKDRLLLGRATDWIGEADEPVLGVGLKMFYVNETAKTIMELEDLRFDPQ